MVLRGSSYYQNSTNVLYAVAAHGVSQRIDALGITNRPSLMGWPILFDLLSNTDRKQVGGLYKAYGVNE